MRLKHESLLTAVEAGVAGSRQELAGALGVVPSVVANVDDLEQPGALRRVRDRDDRRRQNLVLTLRGALLEDCTTAAREVDAEITADLGDTQRVALRELLGLLAETEGFRYKC